MTDEEIWKDIKGYENLYQISNLGNVRSLDRYKVTKGRYGEMKAKIKGKVLIPCINHDGYKEIVLSKNGKSKMYRLHRIVAEAFINNDENKNQVNHKNGNKLDNRAENLEWCTCKENIQHALKNNLIKCERRINQYDLKMNFIKEWRSISEIKRVLNISDSNIIKVCNEERNSAGGFKWKYQD